MFRKFFFILTIILFCTNVSAETLILKNGNRVEGEIVEKTDKYIRIEIEEIPVTFYMDEIESVEKEIPAIIVKDEKQKKEIIKKLIEEKAVDRIYDIKVEKKKVIKQPQDYSQIDPVGQPQANIGIQAVHYKDHPDFQGGSNYGSFGTEEYDQTGQPQPNIGIQFVSPEDDPNFQVKDPSEETEEERIRREAAEKFYNER